VFPSQSLQVVPDPVTFLPASVHPHAALGAAPFAQVKPGRATQDICFVAVFVYRPLGHGSQPELAEPAVVELPVEE